MLPLQLSEHSGFLQRFLAAAAAAAAADGGSWSTYLGCVSPPEAKPFLFMVKFELFIYY